MKLSTIIQGFRATEELADKNFTNEEQWQIYNLRKVLRSHVEFYKERENNINAQYIKFADSNGVLSGEKFIEYQNKKKELDDMETSVDYQPIELPVIDGINFKTMEALENFITFKV